jgi:predicted NBD/HSP70 family sugar kinase
MKQLAKNDLRVVRAVFAKDRSTRTSIARATRLSLVKVSAILGTLEKAGHVRRAGKTKSSGGRPSHIYQLGPTLGSALGVSLAPDAIRVLAVNSAKELLWERAFPLELPADLVEKGEAVVQQVSSALRSIIPGLGAEDAPVALGLALPGMVDTRRGVWLQGMQLTGVTHIELARILEEEFHVPVFTEDISRCLAYRELLTGQGRRVRTFVLLYFGMGLGTGVVINRRLYRGCHGLAGEIGHVEHVDNNYRCSCGNIGCLETVVSVPGVLRVFRDRLNEGVISSLQRVGHGRGEELTLERILEAAAQGDRFAQTTLQEVGQFLGHACATLIKLFNPQRLIISGQGAMLREYLVEPVSQVLAREVLPEMLQDYRTVFAEYAPNLGAEGAALLAMNRFINGRLR